MAISPQQINNGDFVDTTNVWDVSEIEQVDVNSEEFKELLVRLYQNLNRMSFAINNRDAGFYVPQEFVNGQLFYPNPSLTSLSTTTPTLRQDFRYVVVFGALPNATTKSVAHGLSPTTAWTATRIYAEASDTTNLAYIPIPYASPTLVYNIELNIDATNVNITTGSDRSNFNECKVIFEYLKS